MLKLVSVFSRPCTSCQWRKLWGRKTNTHPATWVARRFASSDSKAAAGASDISLQDSVTQSKQGCDPSSDAAPDPLCHDTDPDLHPDLDQVFPDDGVATDSQREVISKTSARRRMVIDLQREGNSRFAARRNEARQRFLSQTTPWRRPDGYDTGVCVFNSLTRQTEPLILPRGKLATWYSCGPTVYDEAHIGHACTYVVSDVMRRVLTHMFDVEVLMVMGITDIDDKIINRANERSVDFQTLAKHFEKRFFEDMARLNVAPPMVKLRVSDHIPHIISFVQRLIDKGIAYVVPSGSVYFDLKKYGKPGKLLTEVEQETNKPTDNKRSVSDFAVWKAKKAGNPFWDSPWGPGRPGWHIECSAMASAVFGESLDIHFGGFDLKFPHHQCEIAQCEACFDSDQWTNYWIHSGHLHLKADPYKMSKSRFNTIEVGEFLESYTANQFRLYCMQNLYRKPKEFHEKSMRDVATQLVNWQTFIGSARGFLHGRVDCGPLDSPLLMERLAATRTEIQSAMADDFNTPLAVQLLNELINVAHAQMSTYPTGQTYVRDTTAMGAVLQFVDTITSVWGFQLFTQHTADSAELQQRFEGVMDSLVAFRGRVRDIARKPREHGLSVSESEPETEKAASGKASKKRERPIGVMLSASDELRQQLQLYDVILSDHHKGSSWQVQEGTLSGKRAKQTAPDPEVKPAEPAERSDS